MKTNLLMLILSFYSVSSQIEPIKVVDLDIKIPIASYQDLTYGFAKGDRIVISFKEERGKNLSQFEIFEHPSHLRFSDYKIKEIRNKEIAVRKTGIYTFRFTNNSLGNRVCKLQINRIPESLEKTRFNTNVSRRVVADTTYTTHNDEYTARSEYLTIPIIIENKYYLNSGSNATWKGGKSRITIPISLPSNTVKWYYTVSASRQEGETEAVAKDLDLAGDLTKLIDQTGTLGFAFNQLTQPPGSDFCDVYLIDYDNHNSFINKSAFSYFIEGTRENIKSGVIEINSTQFQSQVYLGLKNPDGFNGIHIVLEAAAIVEEQEIRQREIKIPHVTYREEFYIED